MWNSVSVPMDPTYTVNFFTQEIHVLAIVILCPIKNCQPTACNLTFHSLPRNKSVLHKACSDRL